uniref:Uncharacterized protein n=2 Tax=Ixodes ricinus TaxID=34613 RepID=V5ICK2_IXORI
MTTENVPVFAAVASSSSSQAAALASESQQSHPKASPSDIPALVHVPASLPSDISISSQLDIKPSPSSLIPPFEEQALSPAVPPQPSGSGSGDGSSGAMMMAFTDMSGVPAIAGPSNYHPDKQQSTPSHGRYSPPTHTPRPHAPPVFPLPKWSTASSSQVACHATWFAATIGLTACYCFCEVLSGKFSGAS